MSKPETSELERMVVRIQEAGQDWVEAKLKSDQLADGEKNYLASLMNAIDAEMKGQKISDTKLERIVRGTPEFGDYVTRKCIAIAETGRKKIRYEALQALFDAKRSDLAFERVKVEKGIFHQGS